MRIPCALALALVVATAACDGNSPTSPSPSPPTAFSGVRYDTIQVSHEFIVGTPVPTQNQASTYCCWPFPVRNAGTFVFDLALFPPNLLPSGGSSNILSESEMVLVGLNTGPATGTVTFQWHKAGGQDVMISRYSGLPSYVATYSYIGRFSWEISEAGSYYVVVETPWGDARLDFLVTNSAPAALAPPSETIPAWPLMRPDSLTRQASGKGGGISQRAPARLRLGASDVTSGSEVPRDD